MTVNLIPSSGYTVVLQWLVWRRYFDWRIWTSLVPIVGGIVLTSVTELSFNAFGFFAALFGCLATSTKTILAESLLHGYKFDRYLPPLRRLNETIDTRKVTRLKFLISQTDFSVQNTRTVLVFT